ncbi:MAG: hypothetical protein GF349_03085 [Candidatus Magasanikbacteria bacterium]|nr:hypothetical protein [Candidatus Magasanikbacteria bacterium]
MFDKTNIWIMVALLMLLGFATRLLPHPPNFTPIAAIAIFGGLYLPKYLSVVIPIAVMLVGDIVIGFYNPYVMISVYVGFILCVVLALIIRKKKKIHYILGTTVFGSILFFLLTNMAVWAFGTLYPHSLAGLIESYTMAIPFFRNSLLGDLFYVGVLVGGFETVKYFLLNNKKIEQKII